MLLFIYKKVINTIWLILSVPKGKPTIILVLQKGISHSVLQKKKTKDKLTCQRLHPNSMAEPVRASEDYIVL